MIIEDTIEFLKKTPPFQFLDEPTLRKVAVNVSMEFYPEGAAILCQDGPPSKFLRIVKKGGVKVFMNSPEDGEEVVIDYRSEGDSFGILSLVSGDKSRTNIVATADTICYLIDRKTMLGLLETNPSFTEFFQSFSNKFIDKTYEEMHSKSRLYSGGDKLLFTTPVGELATKGVVTASHNISIKEAARIMSAKGISSLILVDLNGSPVGIITDRDLRNKVVSKGRDITDRVSSIMGGPLIKAESRDYCFEALLAMIHHNIHHLLVTDQGRLKGVVTNHDFMMLQGTSPITIAREIKSQDCVSGLVPVSKKINGIITLLLKEGAKASNITRIVTEINDMLVKRIIEIAERECGEPPLSYCWIVYGSEGRKETTFRADQDNALIYENPKTKEEADSAEEYFGNFTGFVKDSLTKCGFPLCSGDYMASNPRWRQPIKVWKEYFTKWIVTPTSEAILSSVILFDFRPVYGSFSLAKELKEHLVKTLKNHDIFLKQMADMTVKVRPPLGFFKTFVVEKSGEHKNELNLKFKCIAPLINIARLFALEKGISETSTIERLEALKDKHGLVKEFGDELEQAFEFINLLRVHHQFAQITAGISPDNFIDLNKLSNLEKKTLKESCQLILRVQDSISKEYSPGMTM
ncbi:CBS domain-containing protein [bacterium]|nr:CBS domain-containing protein [bacterium]MBU1615061.1 CBS domain-containing protein [bacterium]